MPTESRADGRAKGEAEVIQPHGEAAFVGWEGAIQAEYADYTAVVSLGVKVFCGLARVELMDVRQHVPNPSAIFSSWQSKIQFTYVEAYRTGELRGDSISQL